jgi:uncharacterized protein (DUF2236 family)
MSELLGIPRDHFPRRLQDFDHYMDEMISSGTVRVSTRAKDLAERIMRPPLRVLPGPTMIPIAIVTAGMLPATLRDQYGLAWGPAQQRLYRLAVKTVPRLVALTPPLMRVWPLPGRNITLKGTSERS